ncbi:3-phosphoshikimate 1-carboxyvinyltransferase [Paenibacillus nuruki]|uniref:3-phosphoshikimate 1-carboxyvinyltransferase n=1 Tax=Paenibacillus nuruki TaxID=1886670 RepID=A0A1E3KWX2_9BACL|nr:3-phosphoshikimate 1-carboxyvinyltransferase [Paenibacillus nuruki]ODP26039.1 3-phosphoshikimate 1-carboxyvinyltransferase [Paenibacillus nuruki]
MHEADLRARSPWSDYNEYSLVEIGPAQKLINSEIVIPGSKSFTNRALIIAALAKGNSFLKGILRSDDSYWCIDALRKLGVEIEVNEESVLVCGVNGKWPNEEAKLYIGAAGTIARFLPGALATSTNGTWTVEASKRMSERPIRPLIDALIDLGADITYLEREGYYPIEVHGNGLKGGDVWISGSISSQFISGVLISAPYAKDPVKVNIKDHIVQHAYVKITIGLMEEFGAKVTYTHDLNNMIIENSQYIGKDITLEADASTCGYFLALAALTQGKIRIINIGYDTNQPDIKMIDIFEKMGCTVTRGDTFIELIGPKQLKGGFDISMKELSDQTMTLATTAIFADGPIAIHDVAHIRTHESDRIKVICDSLSALGIQVEEREDGLTVYPGLPKPVLLQSHDDHRIAMSLALIGARVKGIQITDPGCVSKTCPNFFGMLKDLGLSVNFKDKEEDGK